MRHQLCSYRRGHAALQEAPRKALQEKVQEKLGSGWWWWGGRGVTAELIELAIVEYHEADQHHVVVSPRSELYT